MTQSTMWNEFWHGCGQPQGQCPRKQMLMSWRRGQSRTAACHLGRATRRTANHALTNWTHAVAWTAILTGAALMHPYLTVGSTVIYTAAMSYYTWSHEHLDGQQTDGFKGMAAASYNGGLQWRQLVGRDGQTLFLITAGMLGGGLLLRRQAALRNFAFVATWPAAIVMSKAAASYLAQEN